MRHASSRMLWVSVMAFVHEHIERVCRMMSEPKLQMHYDIRTAPFVTCLFYFEFINRSHTCFMSNAPPLFVRFVRTQIARYIIILDMIPISAQNSFRPTMSTYFISSLCTISGVSIYLCFEHEITVHKQRVARMTGRTCIEIEKNNKLKSGPLAVFVSLESFELH